MEAESISTNQSPSSKKDDIPSKDSTNEQTSITFPELSSVDDEIFLDAPQNLTSSLTRKRSNPSYSTPLKPIPDTLAFRTPDLPANKIDTATPAKRPRSEEIRIPDKKSNDSFTSDYNPSFRSTDDSMSSLDVSFSSPNTSQQMERTSKSNPRANRASGYLSSPASSPMTRDNKADWYQLHDRFFQVEH